MTADRPRRRRAIVAAAILASVVGLTACAGSAEPSGGTTPAPRIEVTGRSIPYQGLQRWSEASVPARSSRDLTVFAIGDEHRGGGPCGPSMLRFRVVERDDAVRVAVLEYRQRRPTGLLCAAVAYGASPHLLRLQRPLGDRRLIDDRTGRTRSPLIGTDLPDIPRPPAGLSASVLRRWEEPAVVQRTWSGGEEPLLSLTVARPAAVRESSPYGRVVAQADVHGTAATVYSTGDDPYGQRSVQWTPNATQTITLSLTDGADRTWTDEDAIRLAREVTGYRTEDTRRLPAPDVPGVAAATYSSADGPVRHVETMLKSSGVHIGVNCAGEGEVRVTMRDRTHRFACMDRITHHVGESRGAPAEPFFLDVEADPGVRWAVTLARASTDGT